MNKLDILDNEAKKIGYKVMSCEGLNKHKPGTYNYYILVRFDILCNEFDIRDYSEQTLEEIEELLNQLKSRKFKVLPEFQEKWGNTCNDDTILDLEEIYRLSIEWDYFLSDLLQEVEEI